MHSLTRITGITLLLIGLTLSSAMAADEETLGQQAEQTGNLRQALTHYINALQSPEEYSPKDQRLREKVISIVQKLKPPPAVPEEAERYMARGRAAVKAATSTKDFVKAAKEFIKALRIAPWLAEGYYNLGIVEDKAGHYEHTIQNLKLYLLAIPNTPDAKDVKALMYEIEYRKERAQKEAIAKREGEEETKQREREALTRTLSQLEGVWRLTSGGAVFEFRLTPQGDGRFLIERTRYWDSVTGWIIYGPEHWLKRQRFYGILSGNQITGTADWFGCKDDIIQIPITGEVLDQGRRMVIRGRDPVDCFIQSVRAMIKNTPWEHEFRR